MTDDFMQSIKNKFELIKQKYRGNVCAFHTFNTILSRDKCAAFTKSWSELTDNAKNDIYKDLKRI